MISKARCHLFLLSPVYSMIQLHGSAALYFLSYRGTIVLFSRKFRHLCMRSVELHEGSVQQCAYKSNIVYTFLWPLQRPRWMACWCTPAPRWEFTNEKFVCLFVCVSVCLLYSLQTDRYSTIRINMECVQSDSVFLKRFKVKDPKLTQNITLKTTYIIYRKVLCQ